MSDCPHCAHGWDAHIDNRGRTSCLICGCMWPNPANVSPPPEPPTARDELIAAIENVIWNVLASQDSPMGGPFVDREMGTIDSSGSEVDMTAVAAAVAELFVDSQDDCSWCHNPCAINGWTTPTDGDEE